MFAETDKNKPGVSLVKLKHPVCFFIPSIIYRHLCLKLFAFFQPQCSTGITRHTPVSSRTQRYGTYLRPIGQAGTLELLRKETAIEVGEPFLDSRAVVHPTESNLGQIENLCRTEAKAQEMEEEEIVQLILGSPFHHI